MMDFHAHLSSCEIIGLLGGQWDSDRKVISIRQAFPCRRALGSHSGTSVELDPEAEVESRALMDAQGLTPVGWSVSLHCHEVDATVRANLAWCYLHGSGSPFCCIVPD